jgi:uncharacterized damage-inducible protein DinB
VAILTKRDELQHRLEASRRRLLAVIAGVTEEQFKRRPAPTSEDPEPWSIAENLAHLLWTERLWAGRMALVLRENEPVITPSRPESHKEEAAAGRRVPVPQLIHGLLASRREAQKSLGTMDDGGLTRTAWHPRLGENLTIEWMAQKIIDHEIDHCLQIEDLRSRLGVAPPPQDAR